MVVKVLDGGAVNGKIWFFYGALADVAYTITVRDHLTDSVRTYNNVHDQPGGYLGLRRGPGTLLSRTLRLVPSSLTLREKGKAMDRPLGPTVARARRNAPEGTDG